VSGFAGFGIALTDGSSGAAVTENDISNNYAGIWLSNGVSNVTVRANVVHHNTHTGLAAGAGIVFFGKNTNVLVSQNFVRDNAGSGIYVAFRRDFSGTKITSNSITGNAVAGLNYAAADATASADATALDAAGNWWGSVTGPAVSSNPGGTGASIVD